jgi:hypothetical protein
MKIPIVEEASSDSKQHPRLRPISPPLLPRELDEKPYVPSSPASRMQVLPDPSDHDERMNKVNDDISNQIRIGTENAAPAAVGEIEQLLESAQYGSAHDKLSMFEAYEEPPPRRGKYLRILKLEPPEIEPLSPPTTRQKKNSKRSTLASPLENLLSEEIKCEAFSSDDIDQPFKNDLLAQLAHDAAQAVEKDLAEENLEPADTTMRVDVPELDDIELVASRKTITSTEFLQTMVEDHLKNRCRSFDREVERQMRWSPIPSAFLKPVKDEPVEAPPQLNEWMYQPPFYLRSEDLLWRPDVLRVLNISKEDDEDELEEDSSLRDEPAGKLPSSLKRPGLPNLEESFFKRPPRQIKVPKGKPDAPGFGSLAGFMDTRKAYKKPRWDFEAKPTETIQAKAACAVQSERKSVDWVQVPAKPTERSVMEKLTFIAPQAPKVTSPQSIIINTKLLKSHRQLTQALETRPDPLLVIIYRDLETGNETQIEPDIIITPTTAAIFTTLQATTQRSLPGQGSSRPPIFNRILHLSQLYDRLLVITTLLPTDTSPVDSSQTCTQISTLTSFCASLSLPHPASASIVQPILIPTSPHRPTTIPSNPSPCSPSPLYQWTYPLILKHALSPTTPTSTPTQSPTPLLLPEETVWELFLRRAGMNPYSARVVLGLLKKQPEKNAHEQEMGCDALWGLGAFVQMTREERMSGFARLVGRRVVERISDVLDRRWGPGEGGSVGRVVVQEDHLLGQHGGRWERVYGSWGDDGSGSINEAMLV